MKRCPILLLARGIVKHFSNTIYYQKKKRPHIEKAA
jgi:hypothetical protein